MGEMLDFLFVFLRQFAGGPGPAENNLVRFGLSAIMWGALFLVAWNRNRSEDLPREKLLVWGFGLGFVRALFMFWQTGAHMLLTGGESTHWDIYHPPLEHALSMAAIVVIAGAYLLYVLDDERLSKRYLQIGLLITAVCFLITSMSWPRRLVIDPEILFHQTWEAWLFHVPLSVLIVFAILLLSKKRGWLRNVVIVALMFFFLGETLLLINYATDRAYRHFICPISNAFHILAIPLLGYVYLREQGIEKRRAVRKLEEYREHLEDQVKSRTASLISVNTQLKREIFKREKAEDALDKLARQNELILDSAGEGICGLDHDGKLIFVNPAAARMLGYKVEELIGRPSHKLWHCSNEKKDNYTIGDDPVYEAYRHGKAHRGDDQVFWRKDGANFPVRYISSPTYENGRLAGAVIVFQDITERKRAEVAIAQRNARLAAQNAVAATLSQSLELETILNNALDTVLSVLEMEVGLVFLIDRETGCLHLQIYRGSIPSERVQECIQKQSPYNQISNEAVKTLSAVAKNISDYPKESLFPIILDEQLYKLVSTPMVSKGQVVGALTLGSKSPEAIQKHDMELLIGIGQQIGLAIENAFLHKQTEWAAALEERHRIAAEMHDGLAQTISLLGLKVDQTANYITRGTEDSAILELRSVRDIVEQTSTDVRRSIASLQDTPQPPRPLQTLLNELSIQYLSGDGPVIEFNSNLKEPVYLSIEQRAQVLPIVQEALLNALRHARANCINLVVEKDGDFIKIIVEDDGKGFDLRSSWEDSRDHFGLQIMRARAARIGGVLHVRSKPGSGTQVDLIWKVEGKDLKRTDRSGNPASTLQKVESGG